MNILQVKPFIKFEIKENKSLKYFLEKTNICDYIKSVINNLIKNGETIIFQIVYKIMDRFYFIVNDFLEVNYIEMIPQFEYISINEII